MAEHFYRFIETLAALATVGAICLPFVWRWASRINVAYTFSENMANNHLPHLYHGQKLIAKKLGVDLPDDPPIQFLTVNGKH